MQRCEHSNPTSPSKCNIIAYTPSLVTPLCIVFGYEGYRHFDTLITCVPIILNSLGGFLAATAQWLLSPWGACPRCPVGTGEGLTWLPPPPPPPPPQRRLLQGGGGGGGVPLLSGCFTLGGLPPVPHGHRGGAHMAAHPPPKDACCRGSVPLLALPGQLSPQVWSRE